MVNPLKVKTVLDYPVSTDAAKLRLIGRDHRSLLRSTGHLKRDGRWESETDSSFHAYREIENPGLGSLRTFSGTEYFAHYDPQFNPVGAEDFTYNWRPSIARAFSSEHYGDYYIRDLPTPVEPDFTDSVLDLNDRGTGYIRRFRPGNPLASLGQFGVELRELPRMPQLGKLLKSRSEFFQRLGKEYLNVEFGWKPFVKDVVQFGHAQLRMQAELAKIRKNNGLKIKRRSRHDIEFTGEDVALEYTLPRPFSLRLDELEDMSGIPFPDEVGAVLRSLYVNGPYNSGADYNITGGGELSISSFSSLETWFCGTFQYYVPDLGSSEWTNRAKGILSGVLPTPDVLYSVMPWSWLIDWFTNLGDVVSNLSVNAVDNEALTNAYVMQVKLNRLDVRADLRWDYYSQQIGDNLFATIAPGTDVVRYSLLKKEKLRHQASPFGFGVPAASFTTRQRALLAALVVSRLGKTTLRAAGRVLPAAFLE